MKAAVRRKYGALNNLSIETVEKPIAGDNEVLIRVHSTTVNRTDYAVLTGKPFIMRFFTGILKPRLIIPGTDFAGRIEAVGKKVRSFKVNDRVCGFNDRGLASQAEYMVFPEDGPIMKVPAKFNYELAAASLEGAHYAYNFINKVELKAGHKVLLNGATGAIGSALLQFLKCYKVYVTCVCDTKNSELIQSLGADKIFDYSSEDFTRDEEKYDFVFDAVGKSTFAKCKPLLKKGGVYISSELGPMAQNLYLPLTTKFIGNKRVIFPIPSDIKRSMRFIRKLIEEGKFTPLIDRTYSLNNTSEAYQYVNKGQKIGNIIISYQDLN